MCLGSLFSLFPVSCVSGCCRILRCLCLRLLLVRLESDIEVSVSHSCFFLAPIGIGCLVLLVCSVYVFRLWLLSAFCLFDWLNLEAEFGCYGIERVAVDALLLNFFLMQLSDGGSGINDKEVPVKTGASLFQRLFTEVISSYFLSLNVVLFGSRRTLTHCTISPQPCETVALMKMLQECSTPLPGTAFSNTSSLF